MNVAITVPKPTLRPGSCDQLTKMSHQFRGCRSRCAAKLWRMPSRRSGAGGISCFARWTRFEKVRLGLDGRAAMTAEICSYRF